MASGQPQMGFLFPCSDCEPLTQLTLKDMWYRSAEVKPGRTQVTLFPSQMEGLHIHTATSAFCRKDDFLLEKYLCQPPQPLEEEERLQCALADKKQETAAGFWSNIPVPETLHGWVLSFLGQHWGKISKVCTFTDKWGELVHQSLPENLSLAPKSDLCQPQHPGLAKCQHSSQEGWASCLYREGNSTKNLGSYISLKDIRLRHLHKLQAVFPPCISWTPGISKYALVPTNAPLPMHVLSYTSDKKHQHLHEKFKGASVLRMLRNTSLLLHNH